MQKRLLPTLFVAALLAACASGPPPPPPWTPAGTYDVSIDAMGMQLDGVMTITEADGEFGGTLSTEVGDVSLTDFVVVDHQLTFAGNSPEFSLAFDVTIENEQLSGQFEVAGMGTASIVGTLRTGNEIR